MRNIFATIIVALACACGVEHQAVGVGDTNDLPPPTEGKVFINASGLDGYANYVFLAFVGQFGQQPVGVLCSMMSDHYSLTGGVVQTVTTVGDNGPCEPTNTDLVLDNGDYSIGFYIFMPGEQTPTRDTSKNFTLYGNTTVITPSLSNWN